MTVEVDRMSDQERLALLEKKFRSLQVGLLTVLPLLDKPYPDDPRWSPWTRFVQPRLRMLEAAFEGKDLDELAALRERM